MDKVIELSKIVMQNDKQIALNNQRMAELDGFYQHLQEKYIHIQMDINQLMEDQYQINNKVGELNKLVLQMEEKLSITPSERKSFITQTIEVIQMMKIVQRKCLGIKKNF